MAASCSSGPTGISGSAPVTVAARVIRTSTARTGSLSGKLLRIDPRETGAAPYSVPADNPFSGQSGRRGEIWAYGLRNPWRFSFDRETGDLVIGDVGQGDWEEIDFAPAPARGRGANFGWGCWEGRHVFDGNSDEPGCRPLPAQVAPAHEYSHSRGCSVTGGYVVRDPALPALRGRYVYGDYCRNPLWSVRLATPNAQDDRQLGLGVPGLSSFGEDACGRVYAISGDGPVYRLEAEGATSSACPAARPTPRCRCPASSGSASRPRERGSAAQTAASGGSAAALDPGTRPGGRPEPATRGPPGARNPRPPDREPRSALAIRRADAHPVGVLDLPTGTVTFLFTDIERSTRLLSELGDEYADVLAEHHRRIRDSVGRHGGVEMGTHGDAFAVVFPRAGSAIAAAADAQRSLAAGPVRFGWVFHTGEPSLTDEGYVGLAVHQAARIAAAGHGGQVVVSETTCALRRRVRAARPREHRLKDIGAPVRLFQLGRDQFPPLRSLSQGRLPIEPSRCSGARRSSTTCCACSAASARARHAHRAGWNRQDEPRSRRSGRARRVV